MYLKEADKINSELYPQAQQVLKDSFNQEIGPKEPGYFPRQRDFDYYNTLSIEQGRLAKGFLRGSTKAGVTIARIEGAVTKNKINAHEVELRHIDELLYHIIMGPEIKENRRHCAFQGIWRTCGGIRAEDIFRLD